jgi:eukaryotic-like serine/threonine-protein kinase
VDSRHRPPASAAAEKTIREAREELPEAGISELGVGSRVGTFRLEELLGEGGMGTVYLAEQLEPVRRKVAVKVLQEKLLDPGHVARFAVEQQALARMSHPAIAQVYDAGTTAEGRPFYAMELVPGEPITEFCRRRRSSLRQRLELFAKVCWGVQHAHQKGLIHRDLKPSNILVAEVDGRPTPKIIDFGIATAVEGRTEKRPIPAARRELVGTPRYMSPEQVDRQDIDTRSDVYSLGAVLYELLAGRPHLGAEDLSSTTPEELHHLLHTRRAEPPSCVVEGQEGDLLTSATHRGARRRLLRQLHGEVDWIALRALALDRDERYPTAAALAQDIEAFLAGRPVSAVPPSLAYRWRTMARRHKALLGGGAAVAAALLIGLAVATWGLLEAREQRDRALEAERTARVEAAKSQRVAAFTQEMLGGIDPAVAGELDKALLRKILEGAAAKIDSELAGQPEVAAAIHGTIGRTYSALSEYPPALEHLTAAVELLEGSVGRSHPETLALLAEIGNIAIVRGEPQTAEALLDEATQGLEQSLGEEHPTTLVALKFLGDLYRAQGRLEEAEPVYLRVVELQRRTRGQEDRATLHSLNVLAMLYHNQGRNGEALPIFQRIAESAPRALGRDHPVTLNALANYATALADAQRFAEAEPLFAEAMELSQRVLGPDHINTLTYTANLAALWERQGRFEEAEPLYLEVLAARRRTLGPEYHNYLETITGLNNLGGLYRQMGRHQEGDRIMADAVAAARRVLPAAHWLLGVLLSNHGAVLVEMARYGEAEAAFLEAQGVFERSVGSEHERAVRNAERLADLYTRRQR